jgi:spoIIIJ-associated protein
MKREFTGKTTQEAIDNGLRELGTTIADVHVEVLQEGAKGLFGLFGSKPARVRITTKEDEREDDDGLSDLLSSFSLDQQKEKPKKPKKEAEKKPQEKEEAPRESSEAPQSRKPEEKKEPKAEKPQEKKEAPAAVKSQEKKETPRADKPLPEEKPSTPVQEKPAAQETEAPAPVQEPAVGEEKKEAPRAEAEGSRRSERKPRPPKKPKVREEEIETPKHEVFAPSEPPEILPEDTAAGMAQHFLMEITRLMGLEVDVYVTENAEETLSLHILGDTLGVLIGRRGETLDALQYLTSLQVNRGHDNYIRVTLDAENYRARREDSLRRLANRMAGRAVKTGRRVALEPMNPYERRILHTALQDNPYVTTHSEGEEPNRHVVIVLKSQTQEEETAEVPEKTEKKEGSGRSRRRRSRRHGQKKKTVRTDNEELSEAPAADDERDGTEPGSEE